MDERKAELTHFLLVGNLWKLKASVKDIGPAFQSLYNPSYIHCMCGWGGEELAGTSSWPLQYQLVLVCWLGVELGPFNLQLF